MTKRTLGVVIIVAACIAAIAGLAAWRNADETAARERRADGLLAAMTGLEENEIEPNRTPAAALLVIAGLGVVCGTIFVAVPPDPQA